MDQQSMDQSLLGRLLYRHHMAGQRLDYLAAGSHLVRREEAGLPVPTSPLARCWHDLERALYLCVKKDDPETPTLDRLCPPDRGRKGPYPCFGQTTVVSLLSLGSYADCLYYSDLSLPASARLDTSLYRLGHCGRVVPHLHGGALSPRRHRRRVDRGSSCVRGMVGEKKAGKTTSFFTRIKGLP